jgi:AraC-like DNA-binding protein
VALLPYGRFDGGRARILLRLSGLGVRDGVIRGQDDEPPAIRARVAELLSRRFVDEVCAALGDLFPGSLGALLRHLLLSAGEPLDPARAARSQFCHEKTLRERLRRAGLPSLNRLIVWTRLFHAAHLLAGTGRSVQQAARAIGYPSAAAFRAQVHRYAGVHVRELRGEGGVQRLVRAFRARRPGACNAISLARPEP